MSNALTVIAVDPGPRWTGIVVRRGSELLAHDVLDRRDRPTPVGADVLSIDPPVDAWALEAARIALSHVRRQAVIHVVAVEQIVAPHAHHRGKVKLIDPGPSIDAALIAGVVLGLLADYAVLGALMVPPDGFGAPVPAGTSPKIARQILEARYPAELIGARETTGGGKAKIQHARAAWDLAGAAIPTLRNRSNTLR